MKTFGPVAPRSNTPEFSRPKLETLFYLHWLSL
jgi:hypothetical protein